MVLPFQDKRLNKLAMKVVNRGRNTSNAAKAFKNEGEVAVNRMETFNALKNRTDRMNKLARDLIS